MYLVLIDESSVSSNNGMSCYGSIANGGSTIMHRSINLGRGVSGSAVTLGRRAYRHIPFLMHITVVATNNCNLSNSIVTYIYMQGGMVHEFSESAT